MTPSHQRRLLAAVVVTCITTGCASWTKEDTDKLVVGTTAGVVANMALTKGIIPDKTVKLSPTVGISLEKLVYWGAYVSAAYLILDPLAPNWEIEQAAFPDSHYHFSLKMKRLYAGGAGESRTVFHQRAKELMRQGGYDGYDVLEYSEGMGSSVLGSQRVSQGVIHLTRK